MSCQKTKKIPTSRILFQLFVFLRASIIKRPVHAARYWFRGLHLHLFTSPNALDPNKPSKWSVGAPGFVISRRRLRERPNLQHTRELLNVHCMHMKIYILKHVFRSADRFKDLSDMFLMTNQGSFEITVAFSTC